MLLLRTPVGRIINRFSKDQSSVDLVIPPRVSDFLICLFTVLSILVVILMGSPYLIFALIPTFVCYYKIQQFYISSSRELKRLVSISNSPIYAHFSETLDGLSSIRYSIHARQALMKCPRAYESQSKMVNENMNFLVTNTKADYVQWMSNRWLGMCVEFLGSLLVLFVSTSVSRNSIRSGVCLTVCRR